MINFSKNGQNPDFNILLLCKKSKISHSKKMTQIPNFWQIIPLIPVLRFFSDMTSNSSDSKYCLSLSYKKSETYNDL